MLQADDLDGIMDAYPYWSPSWNLLPNTYESAHEFWHDLFKSSFPNLKKLLDKKVRTLVHWTPGPPSDDEFLWLELNPKSIVSNPVEALQNRFESG